MSNLELRRRRITLTTEGPDLVWRNQEIFRTKEERLPLANLTSLRIERKADVRLLGAAVLSALLGLGGLVSESPSLGVLFLLLAALLGAAFWYGRTVILVAQSPTA